MQHMPFALCSFVGKNFGGLLGTLSCFLFVFKHMYVPSYTWLGLFLNNKYHVKAQVYVDFVQNHH